MPRKDENIHLQLLLGEDEAQDTALWENFSQICPKIVSILDKILELTYTQRKNTDTFASVCTKMAIFKRPENYPKYMQNSLSFYKLIVHIGETSE